MKSNISKQEEIKRITTAWLIGLGYTPPPYNGKHSKEMIKQLLALLALQRKSIIKEATDMISEVQFGSGSSVLAKGLIIKALKELL